MPRSHSLRAAVASSLEFRARHLLGPDAAPIDYVERWLASGLSLTALARAVSADYGAPISRTFVSFVCQRLTADARQRLKAARTAGGNAEFAPYVADLIPATDTPSRRHDKRSSALVFSDPPRPEPRLVFRG